MLSGYRYLQNKPNDLNLTPGTHRGEKPTIYHLTSIHVLWHVCAHMQTHHHDTQNKKTDRQILSEIGSSGM